MESLISSYYIFTLPFLSDFMDRILGDIENELVSIEGAENKLSHLIRRH